MSSETIPRIVHEALEIPEWKAALVEEMRAFRQNNT